MTSDEATAAVLDFVRTEWDAETFSLPWPSAAAPSTERPRLLIETEAFDPPQDGQILVRAIVRHRDAVQSSMASRGAQRWEAKADLEIQLWAPPGSNSDSVMASLVSTLRRLLEGRKASATSIRPFQGMRSGFDAVNGRVAFKTVRFPFAYVETK